MTRTVFSHSPSSPGLHALSGTFTSCRTASISKRKAIAKTLSSVTRIVVKLAAVRSSRRDFKADAKPVIEQS